MILAETVGKTEFRSDEYLDELEQKMVSTGNQFAGYTSQSSKLSDRTYTYCTAHGSLKCLSTDNMK